MCGIAGIVSWDERPAPVEVVRRMCGALAHRGPDEEGFHQSPGVALGMRRLSIIDLETGHQPLSNEDGTVWVVFNGEIYNFKELRADLQQRGHVFSTTGDTETIVHLYEDYGAQCVEHLRGMFAFAVWDARRRRLLLARDRLGIKPLYYVECNGSLAFASELKALLQWREVTRDLSWEAVGHLFTFLTTPATQSIVAGVRKLEPAHRAVAAGRDSLRLERYWDVRFEPDLRSTEDELVERLRDLVIEAVRLHLVSDVPLGAFLSGGIDSSSVVATMAELGAGPVKTFSIGFPDQDFDELRYARRVAAAFGTDHHELVLEPDVLGVVDDLAWYLDEPFGDPSAIPTYMVSKLASRFVKVVLSGDGGDELFAGYDKYRVEQRERRIDLLPAALRAPAGWAARVWPEWGRGRNFLRHVALSGASRYLDASTLFQRAEQAELFRDEVFERVGRIDPGADARTCLATTERWLSSIQHFDLRTYLPLDILTKVDRMSMAHSVEARPPLLDHRLVEFAATVPPRLRLQGRTTKYLFKQAMRGRVPEEIVCRPKQGFGVPLARWFRGGLSDFVRDLLLCDTSRQRGIFNSGYIERLLRLHERGRNLDFHLWTLMSFELWCRTFLDARGEPRPVRRAAASFDATPQVACR